MSTARTAVLTCFRSAARPRPGLTGAHTRTLLAQCATTSLIQLLCSLSASQLSAAT